MVKAGTNTYKAEVPAELLAPGQISYRILVQDGEQHITFPGGHKGNPWAWDYYQNDTWQTFVAASNGKLELFNATTDRNLFVFPNLWRSDERALQATEKPGQLALKLTAKELPKEQAMGFQAYIADKLQGRVAELAAFDKLIIRIRTASASPAQVKVGLILENATAFATQVTADGTFKDIEIPLNTLKPAPFMLLPRPYPGFHPFLFEVAKPAAFLLQEVEKLEVSLGREQGTTNSNAPFSFEIEAVWLEKGKYNELHLPPLPLLNR